MKFTCSKARRLDVLRTNGTDNAIDFLEVLDRDAVNRAMATLDRVVLAPGRETNRRHVSNVRARVAARNDASNCPRCAGPLLERTNRRTGEVFLGCARYPACKGTRRHGGR